MTKIEIKDLSILFGPEKAKAKKMIKQGKSKQEILKETGCTIAVRNANLEIKEGEMFVIMGLSGSGKSTLVRCINRLNEPSMLSLIHISEPTRQAEISYAVFCLKKKKKKKTKIEGA